MQTIKKIITSTQGYKTYATCLAGIATALAYFTFHKIDLNTFQLLLSLEGFGTVAALRSALKGLVDQLPDTTSTPTPGLTGTPFQG